MKYIVIKSISLILCAALAISTIPTNALALRPIAARNGLPPLIPNLKTSSAGTSFSEILSAKHQRIYESFLTAPGTDNAVTFPILGTDGQFKNIAMFTPTPAEDGMVMAIESSYICGTDLGKVRGERNTDPNTKGILSHEAAGVVVALGKKVKGYSEGDRVVIDPNISCGQCLNCKKGGPHLCINRTAYSHAIPGFFAPWVVISAEAIQSGNVVKISRKIPSKYSALSEPIACALYDLWGAKHRVKGKSQKLVIWGAGFQGIIHAVLASLVDKPVTYSGDSIDVRYPEIIIFDTNKERVNMARETLDAMGLYHIKVYDSNMSPDQKKQIYAGTDTSIIAFSPTTKDIAEKAYLEAASLTNRGGAVSVYGGTPKAWGDIPTGRVRSSETTFFGNSGAPTSILKQVYKLIEEGVLSQALLDNLITHEIELKDLPMAFEIAKGGQALKIRIICNEDFTGLHLAANDKERELLDIINKAEAGGLKDVAVSMLSDRTVYFMSSNDRKLIEARLDSLQDADIPSLSAHKRIYNAAQSSDRKEPIRYIVESRPDGIDEIFQSERALGAICPEYVVVLNEQGSVPVVDIKNLENPITDNHNVILLKNNGAVFTVGVNADQARYRNYVTINSARMIRGSQAMGSLTLLAREYVDRLMPLEAAGQELLKGAAANGPAPVPTIKISSSDIDSYRDEIEDIRQKLYKEGREIARRRLADGPGGNISVCTKDRRFMVIKASGKSLENMATEEYVVVDIASGKVVEGFGPVLKSSIETPFHRAIYLARKDVFSVTHAHPIYSAAIATAERSFTLHGDDIPRIPYICPGSTELADGVWSALKDHNAVIMGNHGAVTVGADTYESLRRSIELEDMAKGIVSGEKEFQARYDEYNQKKEELARESDKRDIPAEKKAAHVKTILGLKNELMHLWEELWLESDKVDIKSAAQLEEGKSLVCNLRTKEIFLYNASRKGEIEEGADKHVLLMALRMPETARGRRQVLIHTLRYNRSLVSREIALRILRAMEDNNIISKPYLINDVFQHCHSTYSHSPGNTTEYIAYRGHRLGLLVTGKVDHDTVEGSAEFLKAAEIIGTRNPICGYEQRVLFKGTPFEKMQTNSPGDVGETYIAVHGVVRRSHKIQEEKVRPAKIERFRKTLGFIDNLGIIPAGVSYDEHAAPLTELNNPTEKHVAEAIARQIYISYKDKIAAGEWADIYQCTEDLINAVSDSEKRYSLTDADKEQIRDVVKFTFLMRNRIIKAVRQRPGLAPTPDEIIAYDEFLKDVHDHNELSYYCYLGGEKPCAAESRKVLTREQKQAFIDQVKRDGLMTEEFEKNVALPWLEMENATMLHLLFMYLLFVGTDGIAFMPNRNSPEEIDEVINIARDVGFEHIANGMDVNMPDMPYVYFFYTAREDFIKETLFIVEHESKFRRQLAGDRPATADDLIEMPKELSLDPETLKKYTASALYNMAYARKFVEGRSEKLVIWDADLQGVVLAALAAKVAEVSYDDIILFINGDEQARKAGDLFSSLGLSQIKVYDSTKLRGEDIDRLCEGTDTTIIISSLRGMDANKPRDELTRQFYQDACRRTRRGGVLSLFNGSDEGQNLLDSWYNHYGQLTFTGNKGATRDMLAWADRIIQENILPQQIFGLLVNNSLKSSSAGRAYERAEAEASTARIESLLNNYFREAGADLQLQAGLDTNLQNEHGFALSKPDSERNQIILKINPNILNRDALVEAIEGVVGQDLSTKEAWRQLKDQIWLDGKLEFAVRDVPWIQNTDIRVTDLYDPNVRLLVGLGKVRGSASYEAFYVNGYAKQSLKSMQDIFNKAGYRMIPIPVQMETKQEKEQMPCILHSILRDRRIIRIALTQPVKVIAVDTGLFERLDPDTLPTGAVNTAAIEEDRGGRRYFVGRSTDGEGTTAKAKEELASTGRSLSDAIVGMIGLGGFGRATLGKFLTNANCPKEIRIAARDQSYERVCETVSSIEEAYEKAFSSRPKTKIRIFKYSELDHAQDNHPFQDADVIVDATSVGMNDDETSLQYLDFIRPGTVVLHAAYRDFAGKNRIPPILAEAYKRGAIVHTGLADWIGHQWSQLTEDLKRAEGLTPQMHEWRAPRWDTIGQHIEAVAKDWAQNIKGLRDAMAVLSVPSEDKNVGTITIDGLTLRFEDEVSKTPEIEVHNFKADLYYRQRLFFGDRQIARIGLAINDTAIALHVCFNCFVEQEMRNRGIGEALILRAFVAAAEEAKKRSLSPKWALFISYDGGLNEDWREAQRRMVPVTRILKKLDTNQYDWGWGPALRIADPLDAKLEKVLSAVSPVPDDLVQIQFTTLDRVVEVYHQQSRQLLSNPTQTIPGANSEFSPLSLDAVLRAIRTAA